MYNPQVPAPQSDIEQGKKDIYEVGQTVALPLASNPDMNNSIMRQPFCCSNSARTGSIYWFIISLIFELAILISSCLQEEEELVAGIIASALFFILTIQGLIACYLFKRAQIMFALVGVIIKAILNLIGFIFLLAISAESVKIEFEESDRIDFIMVALVTFLFYSSGVVVVWKVLKERNAAV